MKTNFNGEFETNIESDFDCLNTIKKLNADPWLLLLKERVFQAFTEVNPTDVGMD